MTTVVRLGNTNPQMQVPVPGGAIDADTTAFLASLGAGPPPATMSVPAEHLSVSVTTVEFPDDALNGEVVDLALSTRNDRVLSMIGRQLGDAHRFAIAVNELEQILTIHAGGERPAWVSVQRDDAADPDRLDELDALELALADYFECPRGEPTNLLTSVGRDMLHAQAMSTSAQPASANYMCVSANATAPSTASTTCPGEITTAGGGLLRAQATYAHTTGTTTTTLTKTFTANGSDSLPVTLAKIGILNASTVGTLAFETLLSATATLSASGDSVTITETVTIS